MKKNKYNPITIICFLCVFVCYPPVGINYIYPKLMYYFRIGEVMFFIASFALLIRNRFRCNCITKYIILYYLYIYIVGMIQGNNLPWNSPFSIISMSIILPFFYNKDNKGATKGIIAYFEYLCVIQILSQIIYPNGMAYTHGRYFQNWIIGFKNYPIRYLIPGAIFEVLNAYENEDTFFSKRSILYLVVMIYIIYMSKCATAFVGLSIFLIMIIAYSKFQLPKWASIKVIIFVTISAFCLIYFIGFQKYFRYVIENILEKDLEFTGRYVIWDASFMWVKEHFLFGSGIMEDYFSVLGCASHAHQYWLQIFVCGGMLGFFLHIIIFIKCDELLLQSKSNKVVIAYFAGIFAYLVMGIDEALAHSEMFLPLLAIAVENVRTNKSTINMYSHS